MNIKLQDKNPYITTISGTKIHFLKPKKKEFKIKEAALGMAKTCRFNGQVHGWYSNAEHCILGSMIASNDDVARHFLVHDLGEYIFGDMLSPVKRLFEGYKYHLDQFQDWIAKLLTGTSVVPPEVKEIDDKLCNTEMKVLRGVPNCHLWPDIGTYDNVVFMKLSWEEAYKHYMARFWKLFPEYKDAE